ncbi:MAG: ATP-binding protein [Candidatus Rokuibacteriota bacterium]
MPRRPSRSRSRGHGRARLSLRLLGGFEARLVPGGPLDLAKRKSQALLAYLAVGPNETQPRDTLTAIFWADVPREQARNSLRQTLFLLRRAFTPVVPEVIRTEGDAVVVDRDSMAIDVVEFERLARTEGRQALEQAAALYGGDLLAGLRIDAASFEDWLAPRREQLHTLALGVLQQQLGLRLKRGEAQPALETAARLLTLDPLQESVHHAVMRLHAEQGNTAAALRQYEAYRATLRRELGREPGSDTRDLYHAIRRRQVAAGPAPQPEIPFVGRAAECGVLRRSLDAAWGRRTQVVAVGGEAGVGKSRLVEELITEAVRRRGHVAVGRCYETQQMLPFGPWLDAARTGGLLASEVVQALAPVWRAELARLLPELAPDHGRERSPAPPNHPRLFEGFAHLLEQVAATRPLLIVVEDAHWADEPSLRLLGFLVRRVPAARVLLMVTVRDEELDGVPVLGQVLAELDRERRLTRVSLAPLSRADVAALVLAPARAGATDAVAAGLADEIWSTSEGNAFVAVEMLRARSEGGAIGGEGRRLPERVRLLVGGRLDRLSARGRHLATVAAVVAREMPLPLLALAAGVSGTEAEDEVAELVLRRIFVERPGGVDFAHERFREVALAGVSGGRARQLHRRVAQALEAHHAARLDDHLAAIGSHYLAGEAWEQALGFFRRAGERAFAHGAHREAAACFRHALAALGVLPEDRAGQEQGVDLLLALRHALLPLGEGAGVRDALRRAAELAARLGDRRRQAHVAVYLGNYHWYVGEHARAYELAAGGLQSGAGLGDAALCASATYLMAVSHEARGSHREAVRLLRPLVAAATGGLTSANYGSASASAVFTTSHLARSLSELGDFAAARAAADEGMRIMAPLHHPFLTVHASCSVAIVALRQGRADDAIPLLEGLREITRAGSALVVFPINEWFLAYAYALVGHPDAAELLRRMERLTDEAGFTYYYPFWLTLLGEGYLLAGEPGDALTRAERALELSRQRGERGHEGWGLRLIGDALSALRPRGGEKIAESYRAALAIAEALGMEPLRARCHLGLGRVAGRARRSAEAERHHGIARQLFETMAMTRWLDRAASLNPPGASWPGRLRDSARGS